jgi:hypothetical protein
MGVAEIGGTALENSTQGKTGLLIRLYAGIVERPLSPTGKIGNTAAGSVLIKAGGINPDVLKLFNQLISFPSNLHPRDS